LIREFQEEVGLTIRPVRRLWECVTAWKVHLAWWLGEVDAEATPVANPREVESIHWLTPDEMAQKPELLSSNREFLELVEYGRIVLPL
jgi:8-oxo-dGTP pyrophosphatase MutT (NUDIX family)